MSDPDSCSDTEIACQQLCELGGSNHIRRPKCGDTICGNEDFPEFMEVTCPFRNDDDSCSSSTTLHLLNPKLKVYVGVGGQLPRKTVSGYDLLVPADMRTYNSKSTYIMKLHIVVEIPAGYCGIIRPSMDILRAIPIEFLSGCIITENDRTPIEIMYRAGDSINIQKGDTFAHMLIVPVLNNASVVQVKSMNELS